MYAMRALWISAYYNDEPMVGLLRTTTSRYIEKDAVSIYTRALFYRVQEEIKAGSEDIMVEYLSTLNKTRVTAIQDPFNKARIFEVSVKIMDTNSVDCSCKLFTRVGYLSSHAFFCLGICGIKTIPRQYISNRWMKNAVERFSTLELGEIYDPGSKDNSKRVKTQDCWFEFQGCLSDASGNADVLDYIKTSLSNMRKHITVTMKKPKTRLNSAQIEEVIESRVVEEITIHNPNKSNNKGSRKRIISGAEKSIGCNKRQMRKCAFCKENAFYDSRTCPEKG